MEISEVGKLLQEKGISFTPLGKDYVIKCLNPEHNDTNPSLKIDKLSGIGHCFACGFSLNIFKHFGIITDYKNTAIVSIKEKIAKIVSSKDSLPYPKGYTPIIRDFRGISIKTLNRFGAFTVLGNSDSGLEDRIIFPLKDSTDKIVAFIGRHTSSLGNPRYKLYPAGIEVPMFPAKIEPINGTAILVEGIFDALNLIDKGLNNVIAIMGVNSLHSQKHGLKEDKIALLKLQGITKLILLFDGDDAGRKAANDLEPQLQKANFLVTVLDLEDGQDPGDLTQEEVDALRKFI